MDEYLKQKYGIHVINGKRYYEFNLDSSLAVMDNTSPYYFKYDDIDIYCTSWVRMTLAILEAIDNKSPKTEEELLNVKYRWTKAEVFSRSPKTNYTRFRNLYLHTNHGATHALMNIQELLKLYNIPLKECFLLIRKHFAVEPEEVKSAIRNETIDLFSKILEFKGMKKEAIGVVIASIDTMNRGVLKRIKTGYNDFFLFDDYTYFTNYKTKALEYLKTKHFSDSDKSYRTIFKCLNLLGDFYKKKDEYELLLTNNKL